MIVSTQTDLFKKGVLYLSYSVSLADGVAHETEKAAMEHIRQSEQIPRRIYDEFSSKDEGCY